MLNRFKKIVFCRNGIVDFLVFLKVFSWLYHVLFLKQFLTLFFLLLNSRFLLSLNQWKLCKYLIVEQRYLLKSVEQKYSKNIMRIKFSRPKICLRLFLVLYSKQVWHFFLNLYTQTLCYLTSYANCFLLFRMGTMCNSYQCLLIKQWYKWCQVGKTYGFFMSAYDILLSSSSR